MTQVNVYIIKPIVRSWVPNINFWYTVVFINQRAQAKLKYRKILKISPRTYIFQRPFLRGLFLEGLIFGAAYLRREICVQNRLGYPYSWNEICRFCFILLCIWGQFSKNGRGGGPYIWRGELTEGFLRSRFEGLIHGGAYFRNFTVLLLEKTILHKFHKYWLFC